MYTSDHNATFSRKKKKGKKLSYHHDNYFYVVIFPPGSINNFNSGFFEFLIV